MFKMIIVIGIMVAACGSSESSGEPLAVECTHRTHYDYGPNEGKGAGSCLAINWTCANEVIKFTAVKLDGTDVEHAWTCVEDEACEVAREAMAFYCNVE